MFAVPPENAREFGSVPQPLYVLFAASTAVDAASGVLSYSVDGHLK